MVKEKTPRKRPVGRPATNNLRVVLKLSPETNAHLDAAAAATGATKSEYVALALRDRFRKDNIT